MKILYHHRIRSKDGQYVHVEELIDALRALGHEIILVGPGGMAEEQFGGESRFIGLLKRFLPGALYELLEIAYSVADYRRLAAAIKKHKPDVIYERYNLYLPSGIWAKRRFRLPLLLEVNAPLYEERKKYHGIALQRLARRIESYTWRGADKVLCVTGVLAQYVDAAGVNKENVHIIHNGVDLSRFNVGLSGSQAKQALRLSERVVFGFVGFMRAWHGLDQVLETLTDSPTRHLLAVGDGPGRPGVEARARQLHIEDRVTITGVVTRNEVANYIGAFDIALQPDVVPYASPLKLFEYMAMARAIIAPATDNIREILTDGHNALLFDPADPNAWRAGLERLAADPALRERLGRNARRTLITQGLTWRHNALRVIALAETLLSGPNNMHRHTDKAQETRMIATGGRTRRRH